VDKMMEDGLLEEAGKLAEYSHLQALHTVGYTEFLITCKEKCHWKRR